MTITELRAALKQPGRIPVYLMVPVYAPEQSTATVRHSLPVSKAEALRLLKGCLPEATANAKFVGPNIYIGVS